MNAALLVRLASIAAMAVCVGGAGYELGRAPLKVQLAQQAKAYATEKQHLAEAAATLLAEAQARGDALTTGLLTQQTQIDQLKTEARRAIPLLTTGKPCLSAAALRVLDNAPGLDVAGLPPATGGAAAAGARIATDTDIGGWAVDAGAGFSVCRARLDALIDWHAAAPESR